METRKGLLTKLAGFAGAAAVIAYIGRKHIALRKDKQYMKESDSSLESESDQFTDGNRRPGFPENNQMLNYESPNRKSKYVGSGNAYQSRARGDKLSIWNILFTKNSTHGDESRKD